MKNKSYNTAVEDVLKLLDDNIKKGESILNKRSFFDYFSDNGYDYPKIEGAVYNAKEIKKAVKELKK